MVRKIREGNIKQNIDIIYFCIIYVLVSYVIGYSITVAKEDNTALVYAIVNVMQRIINGNILYTPSVKSIMFWVVFFPIMGLILFLSRIQQIGREAYKGDDLHGSSKWGQNDKLYMKEYEKEFVDPNPYKDPITGEIDELALANFPLARGVYIKTSNLMNLWIHILVYGPTRSGKTRFVLKPAIMSLNASFVVTDPSGDILSSVGELLIKDGYKIKVIDLSDMESSDCYNPLAYLSAEKTDVAYFVDALLKGTDEAGTNSGDPFWRNAEKLMFLACIYYILEYQDDITKRNLAFMLKMINAAQIDENEPNRETEFDKMFQQTANNSLAREYYNAFKKGAGKTLKSIVISCLSRLNTFFIPEFQRLTMYDTMELGKLGHEKTAIFILPKEGEGAFNFLASILYYQAFDKMYNQGRARRKKGENEKSPYHVRFLIDEFANIGEIPGFPEKLATCAKYNISCTIIVQNIGQLKNMYKDNYQTIIGNCGVQIFLGANDTETAEELSKVVGDETVQSMSITYSEGSGKGSKSLSPTGKPLMSMDKILRNWENGKCVVLINRKRALWVDMYKLEEHPNYKYIAGESGDCPSYKWDKYHSVSKTINEADVSILASKEIERMELNSINVIKNKKRIVEEDINDFLNENMKEGAEGAELTSDLLNEFIVSATKANVDGSVTYGNILVTSMQAVAPDRLLDLVSLAQPFFPGKPLLLFADNQSEEMCFCGICEQDDYISFFRALNTATVLECREKEGYIIGKIPADLYIDYVIEVQQGFEQARIENV